MSYILDALRKSESERHQGEVPNLGSNTVLIHAQRGDRPLWPYLLAGALALNGMALLGWLILKPDAPAGGAGPDRLTVQPGMPLAPTAPASQPEPAPARPAAAPLAEMPRTPDAVVPQPEPKPETPMEPVIIRPQSGQGQPPSAAPGLAAGQQAPAQPTPRATPDLAEGILITPNPNRQDILFESASSPRKSPERPVQPVVESVPRLDEMPPSFQRRVPTLRFNSHIYSSVPDARRVMINNIYLREGQSFAGMQVREITEQGVVMVMDGIAFEVNAERDWVNP